jgi:prepilin-type processing-associated H-X9-DG protein
MTDLQRGTPITIAKVIDGTSNTLLFAEKQVSTDRYDNPLSPTGYSEGTYQTYQYNRSGQRTVGTYYPPMADCASTSPNRGAWPKTDPYDRSFGAAHPSGFNAVMGDGSVMMISYNIDLTVLKSVGLRADGAGRSGDLQ